VSAVRLGKEDPASARSRFLARQRRVGAAFRLGVAVASAAVVAVAGALVAIVAVGAVPALRRFGWAFLGGTSWDVPRGVFGAWPALAGTLVTSALALLFAVPVALGVALFASEIAPRWLRTPLAYFVDLGAAVPSVVYGFWAASILVPFLNAVVEPRLARLTGAAAPFSGGSGGMDMLAAGTILAIMIVPTIAALSREALRAVPQDLREGALAVGATRWEATRLTVLGPASPGIAGAVLLGLGRAIGETIAVVLVLNLTYLTPSSLFSPGATIPSWLVNGFFESSGLERSALYELALLLLLLSVVVNLGARWLVHRLESRGWPRRRRTPGFRHVTARGPGTATAGGPEVRPAWWGRVVAARAGRLRRRHAVQALVAVLVVGAVALAAYPLASLLETAVAGGGAAVVRPSFYTSAPPPSCGIGQTNCPLGGVGPEIEGTLVMLGLAAAVAVPAGILVGIYLSEYGRNRLGRAVAVVVDVLVGVPTILIGVVVFAVFLSYDRIDDQSAFAGAAALAVLMVPIVAKAADASLRTVPASVREGALALGFPRHRVTSRVVLGSCRRALVTGSLLAAMRAGGETAALVLTAGTSTLWITNLGAQTPALAPFIFDALTVYASSSARAEAWGAALVLLLIMAVVSLAARLALRGPDGAGSV
jgi:phosphate transport system permease protein